jgi:hypothetical protein
MAMLSRIQREARHTGGVALYLFCCFGIFTTLKKLFLATYQIEYTALIPAVIGTLVLAKVVVLLDMTPSPPISTLGIQSEWPRCTRRCSTAPSAPPCCSQSEYGKPTERLQRSGKPL